MNDRLDAYWMPFTANRQFKKAPRMLAKASGMHFWTPEGRQILDGIAGLWCVNAGHGRPKIVQAIQEQAAEMDFAPPFNMGHPKAFELAERLVEITPRGLNKVFFTNSGSEAVETADRKAQEGVTASGGSRLHRVRFGLVPAVLPVLASQVLYFFESNTRSATIIGIVGAGGIGQYLTELIRVLEMQQVAFLVLMILVTVALIDLVSGRLRRAIIGTAAH